MKRIIKSENEIMKKKKFSKRISSGPWGKFPSANAKTTTKARSLRFSFLFITTSISIVVAVIVVAYKSLFFVIIIVILTSLILRYKSSTSSSLSRWPRSSPMTSPLKPLPTPPPAPALLLQQNEPSR